MYFVTCSFSGGPVATLTVARAGFVIPRVRCCKGYGGYTSITSLGRESQTRGHQLRRPFSSTFGLAWGGETGELQWVTGGFSGELWADTGGISKLKFGIKIDCFVDYFHKLRVYAVRRFLATGKVRA